MKLLAVFALVFACAYADLGLTEWKAEYGAFPTGAMMRYAAPMYYRALAPKPLDPFKIPAGYRVVYDPLVPKVLEGHKIAEDYKVTVDPLELKTLEAYKIPAGYRATYDPENFNDVFGFYPEYKK